MTDHHPTAARPAGPLGAGERKGTRMPTKAQREILTLMARGHRIFSPGEDDAGWIASPTGGRRLHRLTFPGLLRHGWIEADTWRGDYWRITDAGRAALDPLPRPGARDAGEPAP